MFIDCWCWEDRITRNLRDWTLLAWLRRSSADMRMVSPHWRSILLISGTISRNPRIKRLPRRTNLFLLIYVDSLSFVERKKDGSLVSLQPLFLSFDVYSIHLSLMIHNILNDNYARPSSIIVIMSIFIYFSNQIIDHPTWTRILYLLLLVL